MNNFKKYSAYKDSEIIWAGNIPKHWEIKKNKHLFIITKRIVGKLGKDVLSITQRGIKIKDIESGGGQLSMDYSKYQIVEKGDFGMNHMDLLTGFVDISKFDGVMSPDYRVFKLIHPNSNPNYMLYLFQKAYWDKLFFSLGQGSSELGRWRLPADEFKLFKIPVPPLPEQTAIANFLDKKTAEIKEFIALKEKTIELLKERKMAIINELVTGKKVWNGTKWSSPKEVKDSGIEWLGKIPKDWEVKKLKYLVNEKLKYGANESAELENTEFPRYIRITDFGNDGKLKHDTFKSLIPKIAKDYLLNEGDILFARSGGTVGKTFHFTNYRGSACFAGYLIKASADEKKILSKYLYNYTKSGIYEKWKESIFNQATIQNIGADKYNQLILTLPNISEQKLINNYIENVVSEIDKLIDSVVNEITLIKEYKQSLISEVVTGKVDVRGIN